MTKSLITSGKQLCNIFTKYIENTSNVVIYKLGDHHIPLNIKFPKAETTTLINCSKFGIFNILTANTFPNLKKINYLSTHPGNYNICTRFNNVEWKFPDKDYDFYNYMVKNGLGIKNKYLLSKYLTNRQIIDGQNGHDISFTFDICIPDYGIINGEWWRYQFYEYIVKHSNQDIIDIKQEIEEYNLQTEYVKDNINNMDIDILSCDN